MKQRGFTLIELLVVVTIIGVLSATVLASLSGAKLRGNDTGVKAEIGTIATQAVLYYGIANVYQGSGVTNYGGGSATCDQNQSGTKTTVFYDNTTTIDIPIQNAIANLKKDALGGTAKYPGNVVCRSQASTYLVMAQLSNGNWYCADANRDHVIFGPGRGRLDLEARRHHVPIAVDLVPTLFFLRTRSHLRIVCGCHR